MTNPMDLSQYLRKQGKSEVSDFSQYKRKEKSIGKQIEEDLPVSLSRGGVSALVSTPRALTGLLKHGSEALASKGREQAEREEREISPQEAQFTEYVTKILGYPEELLEKIGLPTYKEVAEWHKKKTGREEGELSPIEKGAEVAGSIVGGSLLTPGASLGTGAKAATTGLAAIGAGTAAGLGGEGEAQVAGAVSLPSLVNLIGMIKSGKLSPNSTQAKELYEFGKREGLSEAELAPILQSSGKKKILGGIAQPTERAARAVEASEGALGKIYDRIKERGENLPRSSLKDTEKFMLRLEKISSDLKKSKMPPADKEIAIKKLDDFISKVDTTGIRADEIIDTWQDINSSINWNSFRSGKKVLASIKEPMGEVFGKLSPKDYKDFKTTNKLWGKLQDTARHVTPSKMSNFVKYGEAGALMTSLYSLASTGNPKLLAAMATQKGARLLATEMLINPRLNNLMNKTMASALPGTKAATQKAVRDFAEGLKEYPEIYEEFDFSKMQRKED